MSNREHDWTAFPHQMPASAECWCREMYRGAVEFATGTDIRAEESQSAKCARGEHEAEVFERLELYDKHNPAIRQTIVSAEERNVPQGCSLCRHCRCLFVPR